MTHLHFKDGKFCPQSDVEYEAILYLLDESLFYLEYARPEVRAFISNLTEEEKNFIKQNRLDV